HTLCVKSTSSYSMGKSTHSLATNDHMQWQTYQQNRLIQLQIATLETGSRGQHRKYLPLAFTEQGVAMLSSVLNSQRSIEVNIAIMRTFTRIREMLVSHKKLASKLFLLEKKIGEHGVHIRSIFEAIYELTKPAKIGFKP
ncbi:MAG: hypothetical protein ACKVQC_08750, partial [Elusimicrobiota bacterium]